MSTLRLLSAAALLAVAASANATSFIVTTDGIVGTPQGNVRSDIGCHRLVS